MGEHLPKIHEDAFVQNLHLHNTRGIVLSWALEGQGGTGHVNEQNNDYVKAKICALGYVNDAAAEDALRARARFSYFKRTVMVFRRKVSIRDDIKDDGHDEQDEDERIEEEEEVKDGVFKATPHAPCWDGWGSRDGASYDSVWRVDFSVHFFTNGTLSCKLLPVRTADGDGVTSSRMDAQTTTSADDMANLLTVVVTSSPVRSNPSTRMLLECLASLDRHGGFARCRKVIMCDGFKVRKRSQPKVGVVTDEEAGRYTDFVRRLAHLCRTHHAFHRTRVVRLARRQGSAYAIREAVQAHVRTPFVIIVPHDCVIARPLALGPVLSKMHAQPERISYVKLVGRSTANYAGAAFSQYGVRLEPDDDLAQGLGELTLTPMLRYMDNIAIVSVRFLLEKVFEATSGVRRGTFIEDTYGKHAQMHEWLRSDAFAAKRPLDNGCFLLSDGTAEPMMRHLDGKSYLDPEQRAEAGLPPYKTDWTVALQ